MQFKINEKNVEFKYTECFKGLNALQFYNKLRYSQTINRNIKKNTNAIKKTGQFEKDIYNFLKSAYLNEIREFYNFVSFNNYNIEEFYDVYMAIYTYSIIPKQVQRSKTNLLYMDYDRLVNKVQILTNLRMEKIELIVNDLTFEENQKLDIICTPLIKILDADNKKSFITTSFLFTNSNIERNIFILLEKKYKISNKNFKEDSMINEIVETVRPYKNLKHKFNIKISKEDNQTMTDVDMVLYDYKNNSIIISELKNYSRADTVVQHLNVQGRKEDEGLNKAIKQILKIQDYYISNYKQFLERCFNGEKFYELPETYFLIISKNNLGLGTNEEVSILDTINFFDLLKKNDGNLNKLIQDIKNNVLLPKEGYDYWIDINTMNVANYHISYPMFKIRHRYYV